MTNTMRVHQPIRMKESELGGTIVLSSNPPHFTHEETEPQ